jgi:hypothetical protein
VIKVEGLHSFKAIAFIANRSNPRSIGIETKTYFTPRASLQLTAIFRRSKFTVRNIIQLFFNEKPGESEWIK